MEESPEWALVLEKLLESLTTLSSWVESVNAHLAKLETRISGSDTHKSELELLREELDQVLEEIARVKSSAGEVQQADFHKTLGSLRMRQAKLLLRLGSQAPGADPEAGDDLFGLLH